MCYFCVFTVKILHTMSLKTQLVFSISAKPSNANRLQAATLSISKSLCEVHIIFFKQRCTLNFVSYVNKKYIKSSELFINPQMKDTNAEHDDQIFQRSFTKQSPCRHKPITSPGGTRTSAAEQPQGSVHPETHSHAWAVFPCNSHYRGNACGSLKKRHILCYWRLIYPQPCLSARLPPACHGCTQRAARRFALRRLWFQMISESKEFRIHSARRVTSLSPQAVWAVLSRAGSCLCIPPRRSLHPRAELKKPRNFLQTWGSVHFARSEKGAQMITNC